MESGLFRLIATFIQRITNSLQTQSIEQVLEYIMNNINVWTFPTVPHEAEQQEEENRNAWEQHLVSLDTALLSMLGEENIPIDNIPNVLDELLQSSLLQRRLNRYEGEIQVLFKGILTARGKYIWGCSTAAQRKGYYLAGVGLFTGQRLDEIAPQANDLLIVANAYILDGDQEQEAITAITSLAELLFTIPPFTPNILPGDWHEILEAWLKGDALRDHDFESIDDTLRFVEDGLVYRLPWGLEALRVRAQANNDVIFDEMTIDDFEVGLIVPAVENGSLNRSAAILMQAGFSSRLEAINSIQSTKATFSNSRGFKDWLSSERLTTYISTLGLTNENSVTLWSTFLNEYKPKSDTVWQGTSVTLSAGWKIGVRRQIGQLIKLYNEDTGVTKALSSDGEVIGKLRERYNLLKNGVYRAELEANNFLKVTYWGAGEAPFEVTQLY